MTAPTTSHVHCWHTDPGGRFCCGCEDRPHDTDKTSAADFTEQAQKIIADFITDAEKYAPATLPLELRDRINALATSAHAQGRAEALEQAAEVAKKHKQELIKLGKLDSSVVADLIWDEILALQPDPNFASQRST